MLHTIVDDKKWDFLIPIKGNQPNLFNAVKEHVIKLELSRDSEGVSEFDKLPKCTLTPKKCHGRQEVSVCTVLSGENLKFLDQLSDLKDNLVRPYIKSIAVVDKTTTQMKNGQLSTSPPNRSYYATSVENIDPKYVLQLRSSHWGLEMQHNLLDTALREDLSTKRKNYAMENGNVIRRFALTVYANRPDELADLSARHYFNFNKMSKNEVYKILMAA